MSFLSLEAKSRISKDNRLLKLDKIIDWSVISTKLKGLHKNEINSKGGQIAYDNLKMFKAILLGQWHSLSDPELEEALSIRLDFMLFTGLDKEVPDETTLCRFRNKLVELKLDKVLLEEINRQLMSRGLMLKGANGAVIDATLIESASRPNRVIEIATDREEVDAVPKDGDDKKISIEESKDPDARWLKKGNKFYFGYKGFIRVTGDDGFIDKVEMESANVSEVGKLADMIEDMQGSTMYADKGYYSQDNKSLLKAKKIRNGIMGRASRGHPLNKRQIQRNKIISKVRYIVEQTFGTLKRIFKFTRACYRTKAKVHGQMYFKAICLNLLKASNMVTV